MATKYKGIEGSYDSLKEFSSQKFNHQSIQVEYNDDNTAKMYFWEYNYSPKYTRYTICESLDEQEIEENEIDLSFLDGVFDVGDTLFNTQEDQEEDEQQTLLSDAWEEDKASTGLEDEMDNNDFDPNDELSADESTEVQYIEDKSLEENIKCTKKGTYQGDYIVKDYGRLIYDEYIYSPIESRGKKMVKNVVGDPALIYKMDDLFNRLVRFSASKGITKSEPKMVFLGSTMAKITIYKNQNGEILEETKNYKGEVLVQKYNNPKEKIRITAKYISAGKNAGFEKIFDRKELPIDYSIYEMYVPTNAGGKKSKFRFKNNRKCLYIPKIEFFKNFMNLSYIDNSNYQIVDDKNKLIDIVDMLLKKYPNKDHVIGYDAETQGLRFHRWVKDPHQMVTHSLSWEDHQSIIIPLRMKYCKNINPIEAAEILRPILEEFPILAHNGAADVRFNWCRNKEERININLQEDTMHLIKHIMPFACHKEVIGYGRAIDDLIHQTFVNPTTGETIDMIDLHKYVYKTCDVNFDFSLLNEVYMIYYGCPDTDLMRMLWKVLRPKLDNREQLLAYKNTVLFSKNVAINSSYGGLGVNEEKIRKEKEHAQFILNKLEEVMYKYTGETRETLSFTSAPQKTNYIFGKMGAPIEVARRTSEGKLSADKTVVNRLATIQQDPPTDTFKQDILDEIGDTIITKDDLNRLKYPFCKMLRIHGDLTKNITAFYNGILNNSIDGAYYGDYRIGATDTWRTTDRIQITKKNIKHYLGPINSEDWGWFSVDYAAEEFRLTVNISDDNALKDMLTDYEADPHTMVTSELYDIPPYKVSGDLRKKTKSANFGIIYGMKARALATSIFNTDVPTEDQLKQAQSLYNLYCYKRALMLKPLERAKNHVRNNGWQINHLGYKMVYHQIVDVKDFQEQVYSKDPAKMTTPRVKIDPVQKAKRLGALLNACGNYPIQSFAAGILMTVYNKICAQLHEMGYEDDVVIPLQVHDEIGGYFRKDKVHPYKLLTLFNDCMVTKLEYLHKEKIAPLYIGVGFGSDWGDAKDDDKELPVALQIEMIKEWDEGRAPTLEEINAEGIYKHFDRRISEYMKGRLRAIFSDMTEAKHYNRQEMQHRLNNNMFVGKKIDELFKTNDKKTKEIKIDRYMELILDMPFEQALEQGYTWEEGEKIVEETDRQLTDDEIQDFFFLPQVHERLQVDEETITVDLKGVYTPIAMTAIKYIKSLCNPQDNIHNKQVIIKLDDRNVFLEEKILGMPVNFAEKFDAILKGSNIKITYNKQLKCPIVEVEDSCIEYEYDKKTMRVILDLKRMNALNNNLFKSISSVIEKYTVKSPIANVQIWLRGNTEVDTGLRMVAINDNMRMFCERLIELATLMKDKDTAKVSQYATTNKIPADWINYLESGVV